MAPHTQEQRDLDAFLMDLENWVLQHRWDSRIGIPCGPRRHLDHLWGEVMKEELAEYPRKNWLEYCEWVQNGGGDEWFQDGDPDLAMSHRRYGHAVDRMMPLRRPDGTLARCPDCLRHDTICPCINGHTAASDNLRPEWAARGA